MNGFHFSRPDAPVVMRPKWRHLLFLHWQYAPQTVQSLLPAGLEVDTFGGRAYVGLVPFVMEQVRPVWVPNMGGLGHFYENFAELNVRTYVKRKGVRGVWFFSLDAASSLAVLAARMWFHLPYFKARMRLSCARNGVFRFQSRRRWPNPLPAHFQARYSVEGTAEPARDGSLEQFLVERYVLFSRRKSQMFSGHVYHMPYQIQRVRLEHLRQNCVEAAGLSRPMGAPHALYSRGVDVEVFPLQPS